MPPETGKILPVKLTGLPEIENWRDVLESRYRAILDILRNYHVRFSFVTRV